MTSEEAIKWLIKPTVTSTEVSPTKAKELEAYNMAIEALKGGDAEMSPQSTHMQQSRHDDGRMTMEEVIQRFNGILCSMSISVAQAKFYPSKAELNELCVMAIEALSAEPRGRGMKSICKNCKHKYFCDETVRLYGLPNMRVTECKEFEPI